MKNIQKEFKRKKHVIETAIEFAEYPNGTYECVCYDGIAFCTLEDCDCDDKNNNSPDYLIVRYLTKKEVLANKDLARDILAYRGLYDLGIKNLHFGDIMLYIGRVSTE